MGRGRDYTCDAFFVRSHGVSGQYALAGGGPGLDEVKDLFLSIFYADFAV